MKAIVTIFGETPEISQRVEIYFEYKPFIRWFLWDLFDVTYVKIKTGLAIKPNDLDEDLRVGIAEAIGESPEDVTIVGNIECVNLCSEDTIKMEEIGI